MTIHKCEFRVYYEDTDAGGIMYHAKYINWCERGRSEFLRSVDLTSSEIFEQTGIQFVVRHLEADYFKPAKLDQLLRVESRIKEMKNSSFIMIQSIFCQDSMLFSTTVTLVGVDARGKPVRLPETVRDKISIYQE